MRRGQTIVHWFAAILIPLATTGCWSSLDIKQAAIVTGTGIAKNGEGYTLSLELLSPGGDTDSGGSKSQQGEKAAVVLEHTAPSLHGATRDFIRDIKRRVIYSHNKVWIFDEKVARENILQPLDALQRDQQIRLRSYPFVTPDNPREILETNPLFKDVTSVELALGMQEVRFVSDFVVPDLRSVLRDMNGPTSSTCIPVVRIVRNGEKVMTAIDGTAIIKRGKMVGTLTTQETMGLLWMLGKVRGSSISAMTSTGKNVQIEVTGSQVQVRSALHGQRASANIRIQLQGTLAEIPSEDSLSETWLRDIERRTSADAQSQVEMMLNKLQKQYHADVTDIGWGLYRNNPRGWHRVASRWDEVFSNAQIRVTVDTHIYHKGLVNNTTDDFHKRPKYIPYLPETWMHKAQ